MPKNLLLADDSITIQKVVGITFANEDYKVTSVDNGEDAISKARELQPDIILADVVMPRKNGYEVCEAIKGDPDLRSIPVLLLAGTFEAFDEARARAAHADAHIAKPFESQALINKVRELVEGIAPVAAAAGVLPARPAAAPAPAAAPRPAAPPPAGARPAGPGMPAGARPPGPGMPPGARPPGPGMPPGARPPGPGMPAGARPPGPGMPPGARPPGPGMPAGARPPGPGMPPGARPPGPGMPPGARPPGPGMPPGARPPGPGMPLGARPPGPAPLPRAAAAMPPAARPAPPPAAPARPAAAPRPAPRKDPFGLGDAPPAAAAPAPAAPEPSLPDLSWEDVSEPAAPSLDVSIDEGPALAAEAAPSREIELPESEEPEPELAPMHAFVPPAEATGHKPEAAADGGENVLREALSKASREVIERVVWEVVPQLAETIIRENLDRLVKGRQK